MAQAGAPLAADNDGGSGGLIVRWTVETVDRGRFVPADVLKGGGLADLVHMQIVRFHDKIGVAIFCAILKYRPMRQAVRKSTRPPMIAS